MYSYCARVDDTEGFCQDTYFLNGKPKPPPRTSAWFDRYWGRESMVAYNGVVCENEENGPSTLIMRCPIGHLIRVINAQYGRWNSHTCTMNVNKTTLEMCPKYVDVYAYAQATCNNKSICQLTVNNNTPGVLQDRIAACPHIPKYTRIRWACDPNDTFLSYGN